MKIVACPSDRQAVSHYRLTSVIPWLPHDVEVTVQSGLDLRADDPDNPTRILGAPKLDADALLLQRPTGWWQYEAVKLYKQQGVKIIIELDDDLHALGQFNFAWRQLNPRYNKKANWTWLMKMVREADLVTVSSDALKQRYGRDKAVVLRNCIDESWLSVNGAPQYNNLVGWTGTLASHFGDPRVTHGGIAAALTEHNARFRVIGKVEQVREQFGIHDREIEHVDWQDMKRYPHELAKFGIGVAPLEPSKFNDAKSWLKPLEYAAVGVPCVMSPTPEYVKLHERGVGFLAKDRGRDWKRRVGTLLRDDAAWFEARERSRDAVRDLTIQQNAWRWAEAWQTVLTTR